MEETKAQLNDYIKIAEQVSVPVFFVDSDGEIVSMNNHMSNLVRKGLAEESVGTNILKYKSYLDNGTLAYVKRALRGEKISTDSIPFKLLSHTKTVKRKMDFIPLRRDNTDMILGLMIVIFDSDTKIKVVSESDKEYYDLRTKVWQISAEKDFKNKEELISELLQAVGEIMQCTRVSMILGNPDKDKGFISKYEWKNEGGESHLGEVIPIDWTRSYWGKEYLNIPFDLDKLKGIASLTFLINAIKKRINKLGIKTILLVPFGDINKPEGYITVTQSDYERMWQEREIDILIELSKVLKIRIEQIEQKKKLKLSENKFRALYNNAPVGIYRIDFTKNKIIEVNDYMCRMLGYTKAEILDLSPNNILTPESKILFLKRWALMKMGKDVPTQVEFSVRAKDGKIFHALLNISQIKENNKVVGAHVVAQDITELKKLQTDKSDTEKKFKLLFENMPAAVYLFDLKGKIIDGNKAAEELIGKPKEELIGKTFYNSGLLNKDFFKLLARVMVKLTQGQEAGWHQYGITNSKGEKRMVESNSFPIKFEGKTVVLGIAIDITDKYKLEEKVNKNLDLMQSVFEANLDGIVLSDNMGKVKIVNTKFKKIWNFSEKESVAYDKATIDKMKNQLIKPHNFYSRVEDIINNKEEESYDVLKLRDGRIIERITIPQEVNGKVKGRLWSFRDVTGKRKVEESLKESQDKYRQIFDTAANMITSVDKNGIIVDCNGKVKEFLGYEIGEIVGQPMSKIIHPKSLDNAQKALATILDVGVLRNQEYKMIRKDKKEIIVNINSSALKDKQGKYYQTICMINDITERKEAEKKMKIQEKRFKAILDSVPHAVIGLEERKIVFASAGTKKVFGWDPKDVIGKSTKIFYRSHGDFERIANLVYPRLAERATYAIDFPCRTKDGKNIECLVSLARTSGFEESQNVVVMYENITERKKAEKELAQSESNYRSIFDSVSDAIMIHEVDSTCFVDVNASANKMFGYTTDEFKKMKVGDISEGSKLYDDSQALGFIKKAASSDKDVVVNWKFKNKEGKLFWGEVRLRTAVIAGEKRVLANINDISERIKVEEEIKKRNRELERFNKLVVGREEKMIELKNQIRELQSKLDRQQ